MHGMLYCCTSVSELPPVMNHTGSTPHHILSLGKAISCFERLFSRDLDHHLPTYYQFLLIPYCVKFIKKYLSCVFPCGSRTAIDLRHLQGSCRGGSIFSLSCPLHGRHNTARLYCLTFTQRHTQCQDTHLKILKLNTFCYMNNYQQL